MKKNRRLTTLLMSLAIGLVAVGTILFLRPETADAGIYDTHNETVYAEQWVVHANNYTGGCDFLRDWFIEPSYNVCDKTLSFDMPNLSGATKVEIYIDLWRNRDIPSAVFSINGHTNHQTNVGTDWGRTPYIATIPKSEFQVGSNEITFKDLGGGEYHVHDVAFRVYESSLNVPIGSLTGITASNGFFDPTNPAAAGSDLNIDTDQLILTATVTSENADYVEFHAFYDGYDEDNDGVFRDWHNRGNTLLHPGGTEESPLGGTIDHIATIPVTGAGVYTAIWDMTQVIAQDNVRFKVRIVNRDGTVNYVRDAAGGESVLFNLKRVNTAVAYFINPDFEDIVLYHNGVYPSIAYASVELPPDLSGFSSAYLIGSYWRNPKVRINSDNTQFSVFPDADPLPEGEWFLSNIAIDFNELQGGTNTIEYTHRNSFGEFIEEPGPMLVLRGTVAGGADTTAPTIYNQQPEDGGILVDVNTTVTAALFDAGGVDLDNDLTFSVKEGAGAFVDHTADLNIVGNDINAYLSYTHAGGFAFDTLITIRIEATDKSGNPTVSEFSFTTSPELGLSDLESDDFNACTLNSTRWTFVDPLGGNGPVGMTSEQALISVQEGVIHDLYGNTKNTPRIMQGSNNQPFDIEVKFDSVPDSIIEGQGLIIEQDANDYFRFNYHYDNSGKVRVFAYKTVSGVTTQIGTTAVVTPVPGGSLYLRIQRSDLQTWTFAYSNGSGWKVPVGLQDYDYYMEANQVGIFAINAGNPVPGYVANVDYFWNRDQIDPFESPYPGGEDSKALVIDVAYDGEGAGSVTKNVACGETLIATAIPDPGSSFDHWSGVTAISGNTNTTTPEFSFEKGDVLVAHFTRDEYTLNIDAVSVDHEGNSTSSTAGGNVTTSQAFPYYYDDEVTLTAHPEPGWTFTGWQGAGLSGTQLSKTLTMQQSENVTATFTQDKYNLTVTQPAHGNIIVGLPTDSRSYLLYGEEVTLEAQQTETDWQFAGWGGDLAGSSQNPITVVMTGDLNVTVTFTDQFYIYLPMVIRP